MTLKFSPRFLLFMKMISDICFPNWVDFLSCMSVIESNLWTDFNDGREKIDFHSPNRYYPIVSYIISTPTRMPHAKACQPDWECFSDKLIFHLQSQMDDKDRTIRIQQNKLEQYEIDKTKIVDLNLLAQDAKNIETANSATQTERVSLSFFLFYLSVKLFWFSFNFSCVQCQWVRTI